MTKKVPRKILRIERNFFVILRKKIFWPPTPRRRRRRFFLTGGAPPPATKIDRGAAADPVASADGSKPNSRPISISCDIFLQSGSGSLKPTLHLQFLVLITSVYAFYLSIIIISQPDLFPN